MSDDAVEQAILAYVRGQWERPGSGTAIGPETRLFSTNVIDSFGVLELIAFLEQTFHVNIELAAYDLEDFDTVRKVVALVRTLTPLGT